VEIYSRFNVPHRRAYLSGGPSLTQQHFANEVNINSIIARYNRTGYLTDPLKPGFSRPQFGDFSDIVDFQTAQDIVIRGNEAFASLPSAIRKRFDNDPSLFLSFMDDISNRDEAISLGIISEKVEIEPISVVISEKSGKASKQSEQLST